MSQASFRGKCLSFYYDLFSHVNPDFGLRIAEAGWNAGMSRRGLKVFKMARDC